MKAALSIGDPNRRLRPRRSARPRKRSEAAARVHPSSANRAVIKHILACIDGTEKDKIVLDYAAQVARHFCSHIDVLHVHFDVHGVTLEKKRKGLFDGLLAEPVERAAIEAAGRARHHFENWQAECDLPLCDFGPAAQSSSAQLRKVI